MRRRRRDAEEPRLVDPDLVDRLIAEAREQGVDVAGEGGLFAQLAKTVPELTDHLGYEEGDPAGVGSSNSRNGYTPKKLGTEVGVPDLQVPRDRNGSFEPQTVRKGQRRRRRDGTPVPGPATVWKGLDKRHRRDRRWVTRWSPEQISHRLKLDYPDDESMRISHAQPPHLCAELVRQRRGCGPGSERRLDSHVDRPTEAVMMIRHVR